MRRYALSFKSLNAVLRDIPLKEFQHEDLHRYVAKRNGQVQPATVNRDIVALSKLLSYALASNSVGTGSRRLTNETSNKQATGRNRGTMIGGDNWDNLLKRKDRSRSLVGRSNGFATLDPKGSGGH